jgi:hypothetical protein
MIMKKLAIGTKELTVTMKKEITVELIEKK